MGKKYPALSAPVLLYTEYYCDGSDYDGNLQAVTGSGEIEFQERSVGRFDRIGFWRIRRNL